MPGVVLAPSSSLLSDPSTIILDGSWLHRPDPPTRHAQNEFAEQHLSGARFWSLESISEPHPTLDHMLPSPERFAAFASAAGIERSSNVVVYDVDGCFSAPRTVWTFKAYGHDTVWFLNGGLKAAQEAGLPTQQGEPRQIQPTAYPVPVLQPGYLSSYADVLAASSNGGYPEIVLDARPNSYPAGHIPSSLNVPFPSLLLRKNESYNILLSPVDLKSRLIVILGIELYQKITEGDVKVINSCGKGISAAIVWLALLSLGISSSIYDESWTGYILHTDRPPDSKLR